MSSAPGFGAYPWEQTLGARGLDAERAEFRVWAPRADSVAVLVSGREHPMTDVGHGVREAVLPAAAGDDYMFVLDGARLPDPCSRWQPEGLRGPSRLLADPPRSRVFRPVAAEQLVVYELHVGTFSAAGTFDGAIEHLAELARLGVTAIELMPVAEFPGARGWGYDGVYISATQSSYGGPDGLHRLITAAHDAGLSVILDVVYNHLGASGVTAMEAYGPYFTAKYETPWGKAINYDDADCDPVREWVLQSAEGWIRDFDLDGLRLDAIHVIHDSSPEHIVAAISRRVHAVKQGTIVIAESGLNDPRVMRDAQHGGWGCDAAWADDFHHALRALVTDERDGYYADFGRVAQLAKAFHRPHVDDGDYSPFRRRRFGAPADDLPPSGSSSSARTTTRSATAPSATACRRRPARWPPSARCSPRSRRCCSWARSTANRRRFSSSPITLTRRSRSPRATAAAGSSPPSRPLGTRSPTRRTRPPSRPPSSPANAIRPSRPSTAICLPPAISWRATRPGPRPVTRTRAGCGCAAASTG